MKVKAIITKQDRYDSFHPESWIYTVLAIWMFKHQLNCQDIHRDNNVIYTIWDGERYIEYNADYFEIIDHRLSKYWEVNLFTWTSFQIWISHWLNIPWFAVNVLFEWWPDRLLFQKYRKMMEQEFDDNLDKKSAEYINYASIPDEEYIWQPEQPIISPPIWKIF